VLNLIYDGCRLVYEKDVNRRTLWNNELCHIKLVIDYMLMVR